MPMMCFKDFCKSALYFSTEYIINIMIFFGVASFRDFSSNRVNLYNKRNIILYSSILFCKSKCHVFDIHTELSNILQLKLSHI